MVPFHSIGRHTLRITDVVAVTERASWRGWWRPGFDVLLANGQRLVMSPAEFKQLQERQQLHQTTMQIYGMVKALGARG